MVLEQWKEYPKTYELINNKKFFQELKTNLINVIQDYADLGVNDEAFMIAKTQTLFSGQIVPRKKDWVLLEEILDTLTQKKEFRIIWNELYPEAKPTLGISDLQRIRTFLDNIQRMSPIIQNFNMQIPVPNVLALNKPTVSSTNDFKTSMEIKWSINASTQALKQGTISAFPSPNEDVTGYDLNINAGSYNFTRNFASNMQVLNHNVTLDWWTWFGSNVKQAKLTVTQTAKDKRGNSSSKQLVHQFPSNVKMPAPVKSYELEYKLNNNNWVRIANVSSLNYVWIAIPKATGNYTFRVRALDQINDYTAWVESDPIYLQYVDYSMSPPIVSGTPTINSITATWTHVDRAQTYEIWIGDETTAKNTHTSSNTRWVSRPATSTRSLVFNNLNPTTDYKITVRAINPQNRVQGQTTVRTLTPSVPQTKTYKPIGNQVYNWGYHMLHYINTRSGTYYGPHWHNGGIGDSTGVYQGEWVDGRWTGDQNWAGYTWRGGWAYQAWDGQHWGNRMSFVHYDYEQMRRDMRGKKIVNVVVTAVRGSSYHGYATGHPLYLYNHKREYTGSITSGTTTSSSGAKYYTVKSGDYLSKIATAHGITVTQLKSWNNLSSDLIHPGDKLQVSASAVSNPTPTVSDNSLKLYRADNLALLNRSNQIAAYTWGITQGNNIAFSNDVAKQLVHNIANGEMKGIGMAILYGPEYSTPAGYYNQDLAYMTFNKGSFSLTVTYQ